MALDEDYTTANEPLPVPPVEAYEQNGRIVGSRSARANSTYLTPPYDPHAEQALLGAMLLYSQPAIEAAKLVVEPDDFYPPAGPHAAICAAIYALHGSGQPVDTITVCDELRRTKMLDHAGGERAIIATQAEALPNATRYAEIVARHAQARRLIALGEEIRKAGFGMDVEGATKILSEARATTRLSTVSRAIPGGSFVLDAPEVPPAVWGEGEEILWAAGEPLMINGPTGVGKSTVVQQLVLARLGLRDDLLGYAVSAEPRSVLYLAMDRPNQVSRSFRRMVSPLDRDMLDDGLVVWRGPLPFNPLTDHTALPSMARSYGAGTVIIDSLKDFATKLADDESGGLINRSIQACIADGLEVVVTHHQRKKEQTSERKKKDGDVDRLPKPGKIDDVYGSTWITAGMGSVILIWGQPGDIIVELSHLKQPAEVVGPWRITHDHINGITTRSDETVDVIETIRTSNGITVEGVARAITGRENPDRAGVARARRKLNNLIKKGIVSAVDGGKDPAGKQLPTRHYLVEAHRDEPF